MNRGERREGAEWKAERSMRDRGREESHSGIIKCHSLLARAPEGRVGWRVLGREWGGGGMMNTSLITFVISVSR